MDSTDKEIIQRLKNDVDESLRSDSRSETFNAIKRYELYLNVVSKKDEVDRYERDQNQRLDVAARIVSISLSLSKTGISDSEIIELHPLILNVAEGQEPVAEFAVGMARFASFIDSPSFRAGIYSLLSLDEYRGLDWNINKNKQFDLLRKIVLKSGPWREFFKIPEDILEFIRKFGA